MMSWKLIQFLPDQGKWKNQLIFFYMESDYTKIMPQFIHYYEYLLTSCVNNSGQPQSKLIGCIIYFRRIALNDY